MKLPSWDRMLQALILIRMGQELGTDSQLSRAIHSMCQIVISIFK